MSNVPSPPHADRRRRPAPVIVVAEGHACATLDRLEGLHADRLAAGPRDRHADGAARVAAAFGAPTAPAAPSGRRPPQAVRCVPRSRRARRPAHEILGACREVVDACVHLDAPVPPTPVPTDVVAVPSPLRVPAVAPGPAASRRRRPRVRVVLPRPTRALHLLLCAAGLAVGLAWGLPLEAVGDRCPPRGEGYGQCYLQKSVLPSVVLALGGLVAGHLVAVLTTEAMPGWWRRWRAGERPTRMTRRQADPPYETDPLLLAASWGVRTGRDAD